MSYTKEKINNHPDANTADDSVLIQKISDIELAVAEHNKVIEEFLMNSLNYKKIKNIQKNYKFIEENWLQDDEIFCRYTDKSTTAFFIRTNNTSSKVEEETGVKKTTNKMSDLHIGELVHKGEFEKIPNIEMVNVDGIGKIPTVKIPTLTELQDSCTHDWVNYHGFSDSFTYCAKCDERKE